MNTASNNRVAETATDTDRLIPARKVSNPARNWIGVDAAGQGNERRFVEPETHDLQRLRRRRGGAALDSNRADPVCALSCVAAETVDLYTVDPRLDGRGDLTAP